MTMQNATDPVRGKTVRLSWSDGPTKGTTHEHQFHTDGTVEWHAVKATQESGAHSANKSGPPERPRYSAQKLDDRICLVSYLSKSGYTLTVALDFEGKSATGFASNESTWTPVRGKFEIVN